MTRVLDTSLYYSRGDRQLVLIFMSILLKFIGRILVVFVMWLEVVWFFVCVYDLMLKCSKNDKY